LSLVLFSLDQEGTGCVAIDNPKTAVFASIEDSRKSEIEATGFVIDTTALLSGEAVLKAIRGIAETAIRPVFLLRSLGQDSDQMSDGIVQTLEEAEGRIRFISRCL
jgi:hypothetical protein